MHVGLLTAPFPASKPFAEIAQWAADAGFAALEVSSGSGRHLDPAVVLADGGAQVRQVLERTGLTISGLEHYRGFDVAAPQAYQQDMLALIRMAEAIGAPMICTFAGFCSPGKTKERTIREDLPAVFAPLAEDAAKRGIRIAFENWYATNLQHLGHFRAVTQALPQPNIGFNFDPSHLCWQGIDYQHAVEEFKGRIFHTHAKDVAINESKRAQLGVLEGGWWEYVIPGYGVIPWGQWIRTLTLNGFDGVLSIEHEDRAFSAEDGFRRGLQHLSGYLAAAPAAAPAATATPKRKEGKAHG
jgi:sugar phosphate isomerase/epimerase